VTGYRQPTLQGELAAARELLAASGMRFVVEDNAGPLPPNAERLLAWTVREAVTNVIRHSRARECVIRTWRDAECATVNVADDGLGVPDAGFVAGSGLSGLAERAESAAGHLTMGRAPQGGFSVALAVPIDASTGDGA
jgi:two-component system sensor histidine kinase DesK